MQAPANLAEKLATFTERYSPRTVATYNDNDIMVAKLEGPFHWHKHDETDDFFLVLKGTLDIELRDRTVTLNRSEEHTSELQSHVNLVCRLLLEKKKKKKKIQ